MAVVAAHDEYIKTIFDSSNIFLSSGACCRMRGSFITQLVRPKAVVSIWHACTLHISGINVLYCSHCSVHLSCLCPALGQQPHYNSRETGRTQLREDDD